jgi:hypothetical protein
MTSKLKVYKLKHNHITWAPNFHNAIPTSILTARLINYTTVLPNSKKEIFNISKLMTRSSIQLQISSQHYKAQDSFLHVTLPRLPESRTSMRLHQSNQKFQHWVCPSPPRKKRFEFSETHYLNAALTQHLRKTT